MPTPKTSKPIDPDLITAETAAAILGFGIRKVVRLADAGQLPAPWRFGDKCIRFSRREIEEAAAERATVTVAASAKKSACATVSA
jgi:excisionase family DNA binding protein